MRYPLQLEPGIVADDTVLARIGRWIDGSMVRFVRGRPQLIGGWERIVLTALGGVCRNVFAWMDNASRLNIAFGTHTGLYVFKGGVLYNITPAGLAAGQVNGTGGAGFGTGAYGVGRYSEPSTIDYFPRTWSFGALGEALIANPRGGGIYIWENNPASPAVAVTNAPTAAQAIIVTPERVIMAIGTQEEVSGTVNPRCIRHSDPRDETVWNTGTATLAREKILEGAGRLLTGRVAGYGNFVFTDNEVWDCRYQGSVDEVFSFTRLGEKCGLIGPNAVATDDQRAFWLGPDFQFRTVALGGEPAVVESPMRAMLEENLATVQKDKIVCSTIAGFDEVWFFYPDARDGLENSRAVSFSKTDGWWSKHELARTAFCDAGPASYPVGVTAAGAIYWHERGKSADGDAITWRLESGPQYIDGGDSLILFRDFVPDFREQEGVINLTLVTREESQSSPQEFGPFAVTPTTERIGIKGVGRLVSFRLSGASGPASWRLGTPIFEGRAAGRR